MSSNTDNEWTIKEIVMYQTHDGKTHHSEFSAQDHQKRLKLAYELNRTNPKTLLEWVLPFLELNYDVLDVEDIATLSDKRLMEGLVIRHWECDSQPKYKPTDVRYDGAIYFHHAAPVNSWPGPYGGYVKLDDLLRYAKETLTYLDKTKQ